MKNAQELAHEISLTRSYVGLDKDTGGSAKIPLGYSPLALSTEGNLFAPSVVHVRSYKTGDMAHLSLVRSDKLPESNINMIRSLISEEGADPATWHIKEVVEFMLKHYMLYFGPVLKEIPWQVDEEDREYLAKKDPEQLKALNAGKYIPRIDIDVSKLKFELLVKPSRTLNISMPGFSAKFRLPQFGDIITINAFMKSEFGEKEKEYNEFIKVVQAAREVEDAETLGKLTEETAQYTEFLAVKLETAANVNLALLLQEIDGRKIEGLEQALLVVEEDSRFDLALSQALKREADRVSSTFGAPAELVLRNPITNETKPRGFSFRLYDIFQAVLISEPDRYTITSDA